MSGLTAQYAVSARAAAGLAGAALAVAFVLRAIGDVGDGSLSWLSPIGWSQQTQPFAGHRVWPLVPTVGLTTIAIAGLLGLGRRDLQPRPRHA